MIGFVSSTLASAGPPNSPTAPFPQPDLPLLGEVLRASGIGERERGRIYEPAFQALLEKLKGEAGAVRSGYPRARKLHLALHREVLLRYESTADGLDRVLDHGEYNCLSSSLLYGLVARAFGLQAQLVQMPRHVYVRLLIDGRRVEVESTSRKGFDLHPQWIPATDPFADPDYGLNASFGKYRGVEGGEAEGVDLERAVGFLWHNAGRRALERGEALRAAQSFLEESKLAPSGPNSETLGMLLAQAFRLAYESGNFEDAYRIADIGMQIFPGQTTARDRLLAASLKRIEANCDQGRIVESKEILDRTERTVGSPEDVMRLERGACPVIAAAAVRLEDWNLASSMAQRFIAAEPDGLESEHFARWVARREEEAKSHGGAKACSQILSLLPEERGLPLLESPAAGESAPLPAPAPEPEN
jgi:hypothetical protein